MFVVDLDCIRTMISGEVGPRIEKRYEKRGTHTPLRLYLFQLRTTPHIRLSLSPFNAMSFFSPSQYEPQVRQKGFQLPSPGPDQDTPPPNQPHDLFAVGSINHHSYL